MCRLVTYVFGILKYIRYTSWNSLNLHWVTNVIKQTFELHCELLFFGCHFPYELKHVTIYVD